MIDFPYNCLTRASRTQPHASSALIIDYDLADAERLCRGFRQAGIRSALVAPADSLVDVGVPFVPDIVVIDPFALRCGRNSCKGAVQALRDRFPQVAIVIATDKPSLADCFEAARLGVAAYLPKPAQVCVILASLASTPSPPTPRPANIPLLSLAGHEWDQISRALCISGGNKTKAARILGIARFTLQRKLKKRPSLS